MKRIKIFIVILAILTLTVTSVTFLNGCVNDDVGGLVIDLNGDLKVKINMSKNQDDLMLTPPFEPDQADTTKNKILGTFTLDFLVNDVVTQYDKMEIFYYAKKLEVQKGNAFVELDAGLLKFFKIQLKSKDGAIVVPAHSTESYIGATKLTLGTQYEASIMFDPSIQESEYSDSMREELSGADIKVTICVFANISN